MPGDDLVETFQETLVAEPPAPDRRVRADRRSNKPSNYSGPERREGRRDRRVRTDRRVSTDRYAAPERRRAMRRVEDQETFQKRVEEGELTLEEIEFVRAVDRYKRKFNRPFPTWSEVLAILKELGYTKDSLG